MKLFDTIIMSSTAPSTNVLWLDISNKDGAVIQAFILGKWQKISSGGVVPQDLVERMRRAETNILKLQGDVVEIDGDILKLQLDVARAIDIAEGAHSAEAYDNYQALINAYNVKQNPQESDLGKNLYVKTANVPDAWISEVHNTSVEYEYTTDAAFKSALNSTAGARVGYYTLNALKDKTNLEDYTKSKILTQVQYEELEVKDPSMIYLVITEEL